MPLSHLWTTSLWKVALWIFVSYEELKYRPWTIEMDMNEVTGWVVMGQGRIRN